MKKYTVSGSVLLLLILAPVWLLAAVVYESGPQRVHVLELYTSEGCSSCPPADRWLSGLKDDKRLWHEFIPLAFHVDYWDYIGWQDRFASPAYSERQRQYARGKGLSTVYTPGFLLDGREWRTFFGLRRIALDDDVAGKLTAQIEQHTLRANYMPDGRGQGRLILNVALLGFDIVTRVEAGENRGKELNHDFTVLAYATAPMSATEQGYTGLIQLPSTKTNAPHMGIAIWVNKENDLTPLQATGGLLEQALN